MTIITNNNSTTVIQSKQCTAQLLTARRPTPSTSPKQRAPRPGQLPRLYTEHDVIWYGIANPGQLSQPRPPPVPRAPGRAREAEKSPTSVSAT